jgi:hypothetical protein
MRSGAASLQLHQQQKQEQWQHQCMAPSSPNSSGGVGDSEGRLIMKSKAIAMLAFGDHKCLNRSRPHTAVGGGFCQALLKSINERLRTELFFMLTSVGSIIRANRRTVEWKTALAPFRMQVRVWKCRRFRHVRHTHRMHRFFSRLLAYELVNCQRRASAKRML